MRKLLAASLFLAAAAPVAAHEPMAGVPDVEAMAPALDNMVGALLDVDVGPLLDAAADPYGRHARRPHERTLGDLARRDDPYFDERVHHSIHAGTAQMGAMMHGMAAMLPVFEQTMRQMSRQMDEAMSRSYGRHAPDEGDDFED